MTNNPGNPSTPTGAQGGLIPVACGVETGSGSGGHTHTHPKKREVVVGGTKTRTIDIHAHCAVPKALELMGMKPLGGRGMREDLDMKGSLDLRLSIMDQQGIDIEALSINPNWYKVDDQDLAAQIIQVQNEALAEACATTPDRFVAFASVALQFPELAAQQLEDGVKKYGLKGAGVGGNVAGEELADPKFHPFWAKAEELGVVMFIHPQADGAPTQLGHRFKGNGYLSNVIGNPLETTIALSHLIFEGTLDRFPGLKICAAHAGGFLPSYAGRFDHGCTTRPDLCPGGEHGCIEKAPSEYLKQIYFDTMLFRPEGVRHLAAEVGVSQLMVGTDYPFPWTDKAVDLILETPDLSDDDKRAILWGNAAGLLGLEPR